MASVNHLETIMRRLRRSNPAAFRQLCWYITVRLDSAERVKLQASKRMKKKRASKPLA